MRSRTTGRRGSVAVALVSLVAVTAMFTPAQAVQSFVVAGPGNAASPLYYTPMVILQKGQALTFVNLDIAPHDVRSTTGKFSSAVIGIGKRTAVNGVKSLPKGVYPFYCTIHPNMKGRLRII